MCQFHFSYELLKCALGRNEDYRRSGLSSDSSLLIGRNRSSWFQPTSCSPKCSSSSSDFPRKLGLVHKFSEINRINIKNQKKTGPFVKIFIKLVNIKPQKVNVLLKKAWWTQRAGWKGNERGYPSLESTPSTWIFNPGKSLCGPRE